MKSYCFNVNNVSVKGGISKSLYDISKKAMPVIICVGTDSVIGDSLGPIVGNLLKDKLEGRAYVYGSLNNPITAREVDYLASLVSLIHPNSTVIAIDAALGDKNEAGLIKIEQKALKPGIGANKNLSQIGDISILGVVSYRSEGNKVFLNETRLRLVYEMAESISQGIEDYLDALAQ